MNVVDFYKRQITVARIFGIPVRFDYRWFIVFLLSVWLIANPVNMARRAIIATTALRPMGICFLAGVLCWARRG